MSKKLELDYCEKLMLSVYDWNLKQGCTKERAIKDAAELVYGRDFKPYGIKRLKHLLNIDKSKLIYPSLKIVSPHKSTCSKCGRKFNNSVLFPELYCDMCRKNLDV